MSVEFTGERVIPGQVNVDLWNEHLSRYAFASRLARRKRVLDLGCGTGYGANELSRNASCVIGIDLHEEAIVYASRHSQGNSRFLQGDVRSLPFANGSFDLITCFEVIEHLEDWQTLLAEASRTLAPAGQCIVSTPNKDYYAQARGIHGPNPFHKHEFTLDEFRTALSVQFKHTLLFVQNHTGAIAFQPLVNSDRTTADLRLEERQAGATDANFFVAVCAHQPMMGSPAFLYVPATANVLREREEHIQRLEAELALKEQWLASAQKAHAALIEEHDHQSEELKKANAWALDLNKRIADAGEVITGLQGELSELHRSTTEVLAQRDETIASHEQAIRSYLGETERLEQELGQAIRWGQQKEAELTEELNEARSQLHQCIDLLHQAEQTVEERTLWAQSLSREVEGLQTIVANVRDARWIRLGRRLGVGPRID